MRTSASSGSPLMPTEAGCALPSGSCDDTDLKAKKARLEVVLHGEQRAEGDEPMRAGTLLVAAAPAAAGGAVAHCSSGTASGGGGGQPEATHLSVDPSHQCPGAPWLLPEAAWSLGLPE
mgnify:CR=1 FL=1